jgi:HEAT repeat protein
MTEDTSPENLRKFLESDDPAMVRMGISLAKGAGVEVTAEDLKHFLKSEEVETIKTGIMLADEAGVGDEAMEMLCARAFYAMGPSRMDEASCKALAEIGDSRAVERISSMVPPYKDGWRQRLAAVLRAAKVLGWIDGTRAAEFLIANIPEDGKTDSGRRNRRYVDSMVDIVIALGETGAVQAVKPLLEALSDYYSEVRESAYEALIEIGRPAVPALVEALSAEDSATRSGVARALEAIGWEPDTDKLKALYLIALEDWYGCIELGETAVEPLIKALDVIPLTWFPWNSDVILDIRVGAADTLGGLGNERAVEPLSRILEADDDVIEDEEYTTELLLAAVKALGEIGDERAVEPFPSSLNPSNALIALIKAYDEEDDKFWDGERWVPVSDAAKEALKKLGHGVE